jgi:hypothetical protein
MNNELPKYLFGNVSEREQKNAMTNMAAAKDAPSSHPLVQKQSAHEQTAMDRLKMRASDYVSCVAECNDHYPLYSDSPTRKDDLDQCRKKC